MQDILHNSQFNLGETNTDGLKHCTQVLFFVLRMVRVER